MSQLVRVLGRPTLCGVEVSRVFPRCWSAPRGFEIPAAALVRHPRRFDA